jgi:uncharacterized protein YcbK (DUF882 family)
MMNKSDISPYIDKKNRLSRRRFIQMAAAGSSLIAAVIPASATAKSRILYRQRHHNPSGIIYDEYNEINEVFATTTHRDFGQPQEHQAHATRKNSLLSSFTERHRPRDLTLYVESSGEKLSFTYYEKGRYLADAMREINHLLRDQQNGKVHTIDPELLDQLYQLKGILAVGKKPYHVLSAYRSPETNARMHRHSKRVAAKSLHMSGKAIDIRLEGIKTSSIRDAALSLAQGGVGYYPHANFVHVDTGNFRTW